MAGDVKAKETRCPDCGYRVLFWSDRTLAVCGNCQCRFDPHRKVVKT